MRISTEIESFSKTMGELPAIRMLAEAGFEAYDLSLFQLTREPDCALNRKDYREQAAEIRQAADEAGIVCNQAHAPFPSSVGDPSMDQAIYEKIVRAMEIASIAGAEIIVVHPLQHLKYAEPGNPEKLEEMNIAFYRSLIPYCKQFGIRVAVENMWQYDENRQCIVDSTCSRPEEFCRYLDRIDSQWIVGCLDIGHVPLVGEDVSHMIRCLGRDRLKALHVHDNNLRDDNHALPYTMRIDFAGVTAALREIGYTGDVTFEANSASVRLPDSLKPESARLMYKVGQELVRAIKG